MQELLIKSTPSERVEIMKMLTESRHKEQVERWLGLAGYQDDDDEEISGEFEQMEGERESDNEFDALVQNFQERLERDQFRISKKLVPNVSSAWLGKLRANLGNCGYQSPKGGSALWLNRPQNSA